MAIAGVIRIDATSSMHQESCTHAVSFNRNGQRRAPRPSGATPRFRYRKKRLGKSGNVGAQLSLDFLFDIEKRSGFFAMP
jgi:hypothetical protein